MNTPTKLMFGILHIDMAWFADNGFGELICSEPEQVWATCRNEIDIICDEMRSIPVELPIII